MAAGFLREFAGDRVDVRAAGSEPADRINPVAVEAMGEVGIDIAGGRPELLSTEAVERADYVITMGCGDACPSVPGTTYLEWELDDPAGQDLAGVRPIRDEIERRVR
ncbi:MAG TPA: heat-shock protein HtpX, partial [Actinopolymorphaceae bacterium]